VLGKDFFPKFVEATQPVIIFRTEEMLQKMISCEYPIALSQLPGRVYQRRLDDPSLDMAVAWPQEGIVLLGVPLAILKGSRRPNAARLFMDFLLGEEGMRELVVGEAQFTFREGFKVPGAVRPFAPDPESVNAIPMHWKLLDSLAEIRRIQDEFRRVLNVD
jgi:ABC-type Fe3+ transport system substrate-binding protein